jgi:hypothetical protein
VAHARQQAIIEASPQAIWELLGNPRRHPEWWPHVVEVSGAALDGELTQGSTYKQVTSRPVGTITTDFSVERLEDCREVSMRCLDTGMYSRWLLTEAQGETFVDAELGMDPKGAANRVFDAVAGKRYFRRWLEESLDALKEAVRQDPG